jgi:RHS repeat-associated protein
VGGTPATSYYGFDAHGNITFLTDAGGSVTDSYDYDAWGILVGSIGTTPNVKLYAGEEVDSDVGLINLRDRQYNPGVGRFLTIDPLAGDPREPMTLNRYLYANSDPVNMLDPTGRLAMAEYMAILDATNTIVDFWGGGVFSGMDFSPNVFSAILKKIAETAGGNVEECINMITSQYFVGFPDLYEGILCMLESVRF